MKLVKWLILLLFSANLLADTEAAWQAWQKGEALLVMRHALAPGIGDPANFQLADCSTQRNLNSQGQQQAVVWGQRLRQRTTAPISIYSSQWCRCLDTASYMAVGEVKPLPILNSFFAGRGSRQQQTTALISYFASSTVMQPTVLVTHQVNFTELTGIFPQSAEAAIIALPLSQPAKVLARVAP
ncbi:histidine phosphatase family protein [Rheinheimera sp. UJ51]|uniref:histidine phosphatase family protein n=1 Tax=Rheinheimera sp. UJ51 TaxID=2892446 RepID=UPI001E54D8AF|nr:histidine phosphatase family protein [Rheinheimera sp. UJ51]MCC5450630.1 histidine phosphatase family protein [Rheinheimera sp. UJ51]